MPYPLKLDENRLHIFHESRKKRRLVAELIYDKKQDKYALHYDKKYVLAKDAIPLGPHLSLFKLKHLSEKGKMFPIFMDRIPDKDNPAYKDYCTSQGIFPEEKNPLILLGTIGKRGPSSFIFEPVYQNQFNVTDIITLREKIGLSQEDLALACDIKKVTLQRLEAGTSTDPQTLKQLQLFFEFPEVARKQLKKTGGYLHHDILTKFLTHFELLQKHIENKQ